MVAAKEKAIRFKSGSSIQPVHNESAHPTATKQPSTVVNRISSCDFTARKFQKPPIGTSEKIHLIVHVGAHTKPRKYTGENVVQLRRLHRAPEMSLYRAYFVPDGMDPEGTDKWVGNDGNGSKIFWSGKFCYVKTQVPWKKVDCPNGQGGEDEDSGAVIAAGGVCTFITVDTCTPEPTDVVWPKWVCYAVAGAAAGAVLYCCRRVIVPCSFADCDGGSKPCGDVLIRRCQWDNTLGGMDICGCFP